MLKKVIELFAAPVSHTILSLLFMYHIGTEAIGPSVLVLWIVLLLVVNCLVSMLTAKGRWYAFLVTFGLYILLLAVFTAVRMAVVHQHDLSSDYYGIGMAQFFIGLPVSLGTVVLGSAQGQLLSYLLQERITRLFAVFNGSPNQPVDR
ncbi:hypothetical protein [Paenibacillus kobensis]|uniref:hypothetical protein n=1 Tax=Paenibacillus kobensis TaxID=59841 RepID=UPI000FDA68A6|nr:hypothetical protein [Paenibacillus kobensis]